MALILLLAAAALSAQPPKLILGKDTGAELTLRAPANVKLTFSTSVGKVGEPKRVGDVWQAHYTPPTVHSPSVALVLAQVDEDNGDRDLYWLAIPLTGTDTMVIETRPGSKVEALVAGERIGPVTADQNGNVRLSMVVPPGIAKGTLRISDKLGNTNEKPLDLEPPAFSRLRLAAREDAAAAGSTLEVEIFVVQPDGTPDDDAKLELSADVGGEIAVHRRIGPGLYLGEFEPPEGKKGSAHLQANIAGQTLAMELEVPVSGAAAAPKLWQSSLATQKKWSVSAGALGGVGATYDGAASGAIVLEGALRLAALPLEALVEVGWAGYEQVTQGAGPGLTFASPHAWLLQLGVRAQRQMVRGLDGQVTLLVGMLDQSVDVRNNAGIVTSQSSWTPRLAFAIGATLRMGPGRVLGQVGFDSSGSGVSGLNGSLDGVQLQVGYLVTLR